MSDGISLVWLRQDLRFDDNPALRAAARAGAVIPVYVWSPEEEGDWPPGGVSRWWLHHSLSSLARDLGAVGSGLVMRRGAALAVLDALIGETGATAVYWNRRYEPEAAARDARLEAALRQRGIHTQSFNASLLLEPWEIRTKSRTPYRVFTPFWRACIAQGDPPSPIPAPQRIMRPAKWPASLAVEDLELRPRIPWDAGLGANWMAGAAAGEARLQAFLEGALAGYLEERDRPDRDGTSRLSPYLHFGEVSVRRIWHAVRDCARDRRQRDVIKSAEAYLRQLIWREFAYHLLHHFPVTPAAPFRAEFGGFPWRDDPAALRAWQRGESGYPIIDAGMRQLWVTGWMHNRVRMLAASFLVKDLLLPWQAGARWFWDTLVDADLANNTLGWQWVAGCGADAAPYFRIFNPVIQGEKFDPDGTYVRRWVPELMRVPAAWIHKPWAAPRTVLTEAGVGLGATYPEPVVDHHAAGIRALEAFQRLRTQKARR